VRVAVVTGASSGIGAALCRALRARGWHAVGLSRRAAPDADEHEECDVADRSAVEAAAARVLERHPRIDLLVNNAGVASRGNFLTVDPERIEAVTRTNYLGSVWCLRAFLPGLGEGSWLVNVASLAGLVPVGPYSASKAAQLFFSRSVATELAPLGISVLTVLPGYVETPGFPQRNRFGPLMRPFIVDPPFVAERIVAALDAGKRELVVPRWYRPLVAFPVAFPVTFARLRRHVSSSGWRRSRSARRART